jgi:prenyltransferase beta subunit
MPFLVFLISFSLFTGAQTDGKSTIEYLQRCRHADGGYGNTPASSLAATSAALRALKHFGGQPEELLRTKEYVWSCFQRATGQFADQPGGTPNYRTTASGVMAVVAMGEKFSPADLSRIQVTLLKSDQPEEVRLGAAAIETLILDGQLNKVPSEWQPLLVRVFKKDRQQDGTYGQGPAKARTTAGYTAAFLRLGYPVAEKQRILELLKESQHVTGSWTNEQGQPDLEASYRVMRCLYLMRCKDVLLLDRCEKFIASCRQSDGGYGIAPPSSSSGEKKVSSVSTISGTYFCGSMLHWIEELRK